MSNGYLAPEYKALANVINLQFPNGIEVKYESGKTDYEAERFGDVRRWLNKQMEIAIKKMKGASNG